MLLTYILLAIIVATAISLTTRAVVYAELANGKLFTHRGFVYKSMIVLKNSRVGQVEE